MTDEDSPEDFVLSVVDVFAIGGRGSVVVGPIESGVLRTGDTVEVLDGDRRVTEAQAQIEFLCIRSADPRTFVVRPGHPEMVALRFQDVAIELLRPGQKVHRAAEHVTPS
ncbi:MAG: hypothetical protein LBV34_00215 [Nocardiopsaceae bacterium]|jgi:translation elongation factor EF-1alpha|nr:hypothetical protein [Nocardiopsaceae bacterium]